MLAWVCVFGGCDAGETGFEGLEDSSGKGEERREQGSPRRSRWTMDREYGVEAYVEDVKMCYVGSMSKVIK